MRGEGASDTTAAATTAPLRHKDEQVVKTKSRAILKRPAKSVSESPQSCQKVCSPSAIPNTHNHHDTKTTTDRNLRRTCNSETRMHATKKPTPKSLCVCGNNENKKKVKIGSRGGGYEHYHILQRRRRRRRKRCSGC